MELTALTVGKSLVAGERRFNNTVQVILIEVTVVICFV